MKTAILALAAAMPLMAGTPMYIETETVNPYSLEVAGTYNFAAREMFRYGNTKGPKVNTIGGDITGVYTVNDNSSFNLRFGFTTGSDSKSYDVEYYKLSARVNNFYLMPGYRYTHAIGDYWSFFIGGNVGVINQSVKVRLGGGYIDGLVGKGHDSEYGFAYSGEAGLRYKLSKHFDVFAAYQFFGSTAEVGGTGHRDLSTSMKSQLYHCVRAGVSFDF